MVSGSRVYVETRRSRWRSPVDHLPHRIRVVAYPPEDDTLRLDALRRNRGRWSSPDTAMADVLSKPTKLGRFPTAMTSELSGRRVEIVGDFSMGTDFQNDGTLVMSEDNFLSIFPGRRDPASGGTAINIGVLRVRPGADLDRLKRRRPGRAAAPTCSVLTKDEFIAKEVGFWDRVAPIGTVFNIGVAMGFVVGIVICYQVLYADVSDRLVEFGTLKAMGYSDRRLFRIVIEQAVYLALLGFGAGLAVSVLMFRWVHGATGLPMEFKPGDRAAGPGADGAHVRALRAASRPAASSRSTPRSSTSERRDERPCPCLRTPHAPTPTASRPPASPPTSWRSAPRA